MGYESIDVRPLAGALGTEIVGVDLRQAGDRAWDEIHRAFLEHKVLAIRDQDMGPEDLMTVGRRFGEPSYYPFVEGIEGYPFIFEIVKEPHERQNFGGTWHSDTTYLPKPPLATILLNLEAPTHGGDTLFANQQLAYEGLSEGMRALLGGLVAVNSAGLRSYGGRAGRHDDVGSMKLQNTEKADQIEAKHPAVRTHPVTGRKGLYVNRAHTVRFDGMTESESKPLIEFLAEHATRPEYTCRVRWRSGTLTVWDNRCTQHFAINDYAGQRRRMLRLTVGPQVPA